MEKEHGGMSVASHLISAFIQGIAECAVVIALLTDPYLLLETHRSKQQHMHRESYRFFPTFGLQIVITSTNLFNTCWVRSGWTSIVNCL